MPIDEQPAPAREATLGLGHPESAPGPRQPHQVAGVVDRVLHVPAADALLA